MKETERKDIDGVQHVCTQLPASEATKLLVRLTGLLGQPVLLMLAKGIEGIQDSEAEDLIAIAGQALFERMDEDVMLKTIKEILGNTRAVLGHDDEGNVRGVSVVATFDEHFKGKLWTRLIPCISFALEVNYRDFFDAARSAGSHLAALRSTAAAKGSTGQSISTNGSGESASAATG